MVECRWHDRVTPSLFVAISTEMIGFHEVILFYPLPMCHVCHPSAYRTCLHCKKRVEASGWSLDTPKAMSDVARNQFRICKFKIISTNFVCYFSLTANFRLRMVTWIELF